MFLSGFIAVMFGIVSVARGATVVWDGGHPAQDSWSANQNWNPNGSPSNDGTANLLFTGSIRLTPNANGAWSVNSISFDSAAGAFAITGDTVTLQGTAVAYALANNSTTAQTFGNAFAIGANQTWTANTADLLFTGTVGLGASALELAGSANTSVSGVISGTGSLVKSGAGALTLTGANTYTGGTSVNAGTLQGTTTSLQGNIVNHATLAFNQTTSGTYAGVISGSGNLLLPNTGTVTLSGANTYTGNTTLAAGTLVLGGANALADTTAVSVASGATLQLAFGAETIGSLAGAGSVALGAHTLTAGGTNASTTFSGGLSGTGGIVKTGSGILTLAGSNTYTGGTTVSAGTLQGTTASLQGDILNHAAVVFDQSVNGTYAGVMSGSGSLTKESSGTLTITGANTFTGATNVNAGTLALGAANALSASTAVSIATGATLQLAGAPATVGSLAGAGQVDLGSYGLTAGGTNASTIFSGVTTGTGSLTKAGTGTMTLSGSNTYSGGTTVSAGTLQGTTTSLQGNIVNQAAVVFNQSTDGTYSGALSGSGTVTLQGSGAVTLSGANTYTGTTTVAAGTLGLGATNAFSAGSNLTLGAATTVALGGFSAEVGRLTYNTAIIDFGTAGAANSFLFNGGGASTGTLTVTNYSTGDGDVFAFRTGSTGVDAAFVSGVYFYGTGSGVLGASGQSVAGYAGSWDFIVPDTTPFKTWDGGGNNNFMGTANNWVGDVAPTGSTTLKIAFAGGTRTAPVLNGGNLTLNTLRFDATASAFSLTASGGSTLVFGGSVPGIIQLSASAQSIAAPITLNTTTIVETTGAGPLTLAGVLAGTGGLTKVGANTLVLSGANTYSGATTISDGTVVLQNSAALGSTAAGTTVSGGATLQLENTISVGAEALTLDGTLRNASGFNSYAGAISGQGQVSVDGGVLTLAGTTANSYAGGTAINSGTLDLNKTAGVNAVTGNIVVGNGSGTATLRLLASNQIADTAAITLAASGSPVFNLNGQSETIGSIASGNAAAAVQLAGGALTSGGDNASTTFAGVLSGAGSFTKTGAGTLTLSGANLHTGTTTVSAGTLLLRNSAALGSTAGGTVVNSGAMLQLENNVSVGAEALLLDGTLRSASGANSYSGAISGSGAVTVDGGTLVLGGTAANTFTGPTTVNSGVLELNKTPGQAAVSGSLVIGNGAGTATVRLASSNQISDPAAVTLGAGGTPVFNLDGQAETIGSLASSNPAAAVLLGAGGSLVTGGNNGSTTFAGIISGAGSLTKQGTGTMTLSGANTYTGGTTVSGGTLALGASDVLADSGDLTLGYGATLHLGGTFSERVNTFSFDSATVNLGAAGTANHFLIGSFGAGTGTLTIANWTSGSDTFGVATGTVSQSILDNIFFSNINVGIGAVLSASPVAIGGYGNFYTLAPIPTFVWDGGQAGGPTADLDNWSKGNNWTGNIAPAVGSSKAIVMAGVVQTANDMNGAYQINSLLFRSDAGAFTITSSTADTLTIGGGGINNQSSNTQTLGVALALGATQTWTAASGNLVFNGTSVLNGAHTLTVTGDFDTTINAVIGAGSGGIVKNGTGLLTLSGANTFTGGVTLNAGLVSVGSDANLGAAAGGLTFNGGTLRTSAPLSSARTISLSAGGGTVDTNGFDSTLSGAISGLGTFTKSGGGTLTLSGTNTYSGATTITAGVLRAQHSAALGTAAGSTIVAGNGAALELDSSVNGNLTVTAEALFLNGTGVSGNGALRNFAGSNTFGGPITLATSSTIANSAAGTTLTLSGGINGADQALTIASTGNTTISNNVALGTGSLTKNGSGTLTLSGATATVGQVVVNTGTMVVGTGGTTTLQTAEFSSASGTTLLVASGGAVTAVYGSGNSTFGGVFDAASAGTFTATSVANTSSGLTFGASFTAPNLTLNIGGASIGGSNRADYFRLELSGVSIAVGTLHITGDTILDFNGANATFLSSASLIIDANVKIIVDGWISAANDLAHSTVWYATGTVNGGTLGGTDLVGGIPLNRIGFNGYSGLETTWVSGNHGGWFDHEIRPTPEPSTYGAIMMSAALGFLVYRRLVRRQVATKGRIGGCTGFSDQSELNRGSPLESMLRPARWNFQFRACPNGCNMCCNGGRTWGSRHPTGTSFDVRSRRQNP